MATPLRADAAAPHRGLAARCRTATVPHLVLYASRERPAGGRQPRLLRSLRFGPADRHPAAALARVWSGLTARLPWPHAAAQEAPASSGERPSRRTSSRDTKAPYSSWSGSRDLGTGSAPRQFGRAQNHLCRAGWPLRAVDAVGPLKLYGLRTSIRHGRHEEHGLEREALVLDKGNWQVADLAFARRRIPAEQA